MKTVIYLVKENKEVQTLTPEEKEFSGPIKASGTSVQDLVKDLGRKLSTSAERSAFYGMLRVLVEKGFIKTETIYSGGTHHLGDGG